MKKYLSLLLVFVMILGLTACSTEPRQTEIYNTTHGFYFKVGDQNLLITPSGDPIVFNTDETMNYADGDKIQFNYKELAESYPMQTTAKNIKAFEGEIADTLNAAKTMRKLAENGFQFNEELYATWTANLEPPVEIITDKWQQIAKIVDNLEQTENIMFSPLSLNFALALVSEGANDLVKADFEKYFGMPFDEYIAFYNDYMEKLTDNIEVANAYWIKDELTLNEEFAAAVKDHFKAEVGAEKFDQAFIEKVNNWCSEKTHGLIPSILNNIPANMDAIALNALYFKDSWNEEYEEKDIRSEGLKFKTMDGQELDMTYLYSVESTYFENDAATAFMKLYKNNRYAFIGILPKEEGEFTFESLDIASLLESKAEVETHVLMPEFEFENTHQLTDLVKELGLESIFDGDAFTKISNMPMTVSNILQKTKIKVDRQGTEAAAVTEITMDATGALEAPTLYKEVELNRPFAFIIYDLETETPLFVGRVLSPLS